jgi:hypothetical protein
MRDIGSHGILKLVEQLATNNQFYGYQRGRRYAVRKDYAEKEKRDSWAPLALVLVLGRGRTLRAGPGNLHRTISGVSA